MIKIAISQAAFDAIAATLPLGSVGYENETNEKGERLIWLEVGRDVLSMSSSNSDIQPRQR
jgi:hypothetical protein